MPTYANLIDLNRLSIYHDKAKALFATQTDLDTLDSKVDGIIATGGEPNVLESVKVNGTALAVSNKAVNIAIAEGSANGTIKVNNIDISVHGLGSAAYQNTSAFDASGAAAGVLGTSTDAAGTATVYGALASAAAAQSTANSKDANIIESIKVNGTAQTVSNKSVNITVPTDNASLANGANYATKSYVDSAVGAITGIDFQIVSSLPTTGVKGTIYLVSHSHGTGDSYDEYIYVNNSWEKIGNTDIDLSGYVQTSDITLATDAQVNALFA